MRFIAGCLPFFNLFRAKRAHTEEGTGNRVQGMRDEEEVPERRRKEVSSGLCLVKRGDEDSGFG
jgi:hypothetical protein